MNNVLGGAGVGAVRVVGSEWWLRGGSRLRLLAEFGRQVLARDACRGLPYFGMYR